MRAWASEAKQHNIGRRGLAAILSQPGWSVRILTKNAAVVDDFDLIEQHSDRVLVGLSLTATPENLDLNKVLEPNASGIPVKVTQELARHSTPVLTLGVYTPVDEAAKAAAVATLPLPSVGAPQDPRESAAVGAAMSRPGRARLGKACQEEALDTNDAEVVSSNVLSNAGQDPARAVGRDGVWWPHWSSKPVAGR